MRRFWGILLTLVALAGAGTFERAFGSQWFNIINGQAAGSVGQLNSGTASAWFISGAGTSVSTDPSASAETFVACIKIITELGRDGGCQRLTQTPPGNKIDAAFGGATINLMISSELHAGETLIAHVTLTSDSTPAVTHPTGPVLNQVDPGVFIDGSADLAQPATATGSVSSTLVGGGDLQPGSFGLMTNGQHANGSTAGQQGQPQSRTDPVAANSTVPGEPIWETLSVSASGRYIAFASQSPAIVTGDTNAGYDVFVSDRLNGTIERVSVDSNGNEAMCASTDASISADGRYIAFTSECPFDSADTNLYQDIYLHDRVTQTTRLMSLGADVANERSFSPVIAADGSRIAFWSLATNLISGDTNGAGDTFVVNVDNPVPQRVSISTSGAQANSGPQLDDVFGQYRFNSLSLSWDGDVIAFQSPATNLDDSLADTNGVMDVFTHTLSSGVTERVSLADNDSQASTGASQEPSLSADGRHVAFTSDDAGLVGSGDTNAGPDVFVRDRVLAATTLASVGTSGAQGPGGSAGGWLSADGREVAFVSADPLSPGDTNGDGDVYVRDLDTGKTTLVSIGIDGSPGNSLSYLPRLSADGEHVVFVSFASNFSPDESTALGQHADVFVRDIGRCPCP